MANYSLGIKQSAQKELDALDNAMFARIDRKILALAANPRPSGCKKLKGYNGLVGVPDIDKPTAPEPCRG